MSQPPHVPAPLAQQEHTHTKTLTLNPNNPKTLTLCVQLHRLSAGPASEEARRPLECDAFWYPGGRRGASGVLLH